MLVGGRLPRKVMLVCGRLPQKTKIHFVGKSLDKAKLTYIAVTYRSFYLPINTANQSVSRLIFKNVCVLMYE